MKIAFVLSHAILSPSNGVVSQALTWKVGLENQGHEVILIDMWQKNDWSSFDIIHFFTYNVYMRDFIVSLVKVNPNIVVSPILDPDYSINKLKLFSRWGNSKLGLTNPYYALSSIKNKIKLFFVRSEFEKMYLVKGFRLEPERCIVVPLSYDIDLTKQNLEREHFCLHISLLMDERKNVKRLIQAAKKYQFKLILGGRLHNTEDLNILNQWIGDSDLIEYKGYLSQEEMITLYSRAKVFALPSTNEGVGIVALEAAALGCDIVITKFGGPKEYYKDMAKFVDPYNIDEIGQAIKTLMGNITYQPKLSNYIRNEFSTDTISAQLQNAYQSLND